MISLLNRLLQKHFLSADIQAQAFDSFYSELLKSSYPKISQSLQGHTLPCYNLLTHKGLEYLTQYLSQLDQPLLDYGCGLNFLAPHLPKDIKMKGVDFSQFALEYNRQNYPSYKFEASHLNLTPDLADFPHILINDAFYHFPHPLQKIQTLLKQRPKTLYWVHNFKTPVEELQLKGYEVRNHDLTADFKELVNSWLENISGAHVQEERKIYPLIWDTLEKEMKAHRVALQNGNLHRHHIVFIRN